jgi:hypothetical protein
MVALRTLTLLAFLAFPAGAQPPEALPEAGAPTIGYPTVQAALETLRAKSGVSFRTENEWLIANDDEEIAAYMFVPSGHPAYPTVIKRSVANRDGEAYIETSKAVCDELMSQLTSPAPAPDSVVRCLPMNRIDDTTVIDDDRVLFFVGPERVYLNVLEQTCDGLERSGSFAWRASRGIRNTQLCSGDWITVMERQSSGSACELGGFRLLTQEETDTLLPERPESAP